MLRPILQCRKLPQLHGPASKNLPAELNWSHCPFDLMRAPQVQAVFQLNALAQVSPLDRWPDGYAAWAVEGLVVLRQWQRKQAQK